MRRSGGDLGRSAAGRVAGEAAWPPTALLPRFGVEWEAVDDRHLVARFRLDEVDLELHYGLDAQARIRVCWLDRWGDPDETGTEALHPFGAGTTAFGTFSGLTIPSAGRVGGHFRTDRWPEGVFFTYEITDLRLVTDGRRP